MADKIKFKYCKPLCFNNEIHKQQNVGGFLNAALVVASKEIGLEVNVDKTKYVVMS